MASNCDDNDKHFEELKDWFYKWLTDGGSRNISLLLAGKTGVGKSRLVNGFIGHKAEEETRKKDLRTNTVNTYRTTVAGVDVTVWEFPGLQDGTEFEDIKEILSKIEEVDLVIHCLKMDDTRLRDEDLKAMRILTEVFGKKLWENAVFALTFANKVEDPDTDDDSPEASKQFFEEQFCEWEKTFLEHLPLKAKIDGFIVDDIPKVPTGLVKKLKLPDRENWLTEFWVHCYERMKVGCRVNLFNVNKERMKISNNLNFEESILKQFLDFNASSTSANPNGASYATGKSADHSTPNHTKPDPSKTSAQGCDILTSIGAANTEPAPLEAPANSTTQQGCNHSSSTGSSPNLVFNPDQIKRVGESTWQSFNGWVADKWEGVKKIRQSCS